MTVGAMPIRLTLTRWVSVYGGTINDPELTWVEVERPEQGWERAQVAAGRWWMAVVPYARGPLRVRAGDASGAVRVYTNR